MRWSRLGGLLLLATLVLGACAPAARSTAPTAPDAQSAPAAAASAPAQPARTLQIVTRVEPKNLSLKVPGGAGGVTSDAVARLFNAYLALNDEREITQAYLAEALPQLNTDTWKVFPDGRMETIYRLRPNLTWHDGTPLAADDFAFAFRVYNAPALGFRPAPQDQMEDVVAPDARTVVVRWKRLYPEAGALVDNNLPPLPRHILAQPFEEGASEAFMNHPYWTTEYVGVGPYRVTRWEPGAFVEGTAFAGHAFGPPLIERVRILNASDPNTVVANLLSKAADVAVDDSLRFQHGAILKGQWTADNGGVVLAWPSVVRYIQFQYRTDLANPRALLDLRVRKALAHTITKTELNDALLEGQGIVAETIISPQMRYYGQLERAITKYGPDSRRSEQLMAEAGFTKRDGFYVGANGERLSPPLRSVTGGQEEQEAAILVDGFRRAGFDASAAVLTPTQARDGQILASFPGMATAQTFLVEDTALTKFRTPRIPAAENRWTGSNAGGWSNPEYDRLYDAFSTTLDRTQRDQVMIDLMRLLSDELPGIPLYYNPRIVAHTADLQGPRAGGDTFNVHEWQFR